MTTHYEINRMRKFWLAVLRQAFVDACSKPSGQHCTEVDINQARTWLLSFGSDFKDVCVAAGVHPDQVRKTAHAQRDVGWTGKNLFEVDL
jgi:hypothetical protein